LLANGRVTLEVLQELKAMGLTLAIDDFGTGRSSFRYLRQFRVNKFKIDRSFIRDVAVNPDDAAITAAIISMAKSLRLKVIAEAVENEAQMSFIRKHQCDEIQGQGMMPGVHIDNVGEMAIIEGRFFGARLLSSDATPLVAVTAHCERTMLRPGNISTSPVVLKLPSSCF
jgi:EAL domain-containing protein (putative c-di-GMP-specific phosphodiesterase class I)